MNGIFLCGMRNIVYLREENKKLFSRLFVINLFYIILLDSTELQLQVGRTTVNREMSF